MGRTVVALSVAGLVLASCAGAAPADGRRIEVELSEFGFSQPSIAVKQGEKVTLAFTNRGTVEHEFMAGTFGADGKGFAQDLFAGVKYQVAPAKALHGKRHGAAQGGVWVQPGEVASISFVAPDRPGTYEFGCFVTGHWSAGMKGTLTIE